MAFYRDEPTLLTRVVWYFVPKTNTNLALDNHFYSRIWEREEDIPDPVGEQFRPHPWRGGLPPHAVSTGGLCGTPDQWRDGCLVSDPLPALWPGTLIPVCCQPPPPVLMGGVGIGGKLFASASSGATDCSECSVAPLVWKCTVSGVTNGTCFNASCDAINGTCDLSYQGGCIWQGVQSPAVIGCLGAPGFDIELFSTSGAWFIAVTFVGNLALVGPTFDCLGPNTFVGVASLGYCDGTVTVQISPA